MYDIDDAYPPILVIAYTNEKNFLVVYTTYGDYTNLTLNNPY
jgi:hypothetical protein